MTADQTGEPVLSGSLDLLARAALSPLPRAVEAWASWRAHNDLDETSWAEVRLLGAVAPRIGRLEPGADIAARLGGIQKFLWVTSSACLAAVVPALSKLRENNIDCLLLKGAARVAEDSSALAERLIRDVDVLVPYELAGRAASVLLNADWQLTGWQLEPYRAAPFAAHHAWAFTQGKGELDLHHFSNTLNRMAGDDDALWRRSRNINWRGVDLKVPSTSDALLVSLVHGTRFSEGGNADWIVDAARLLTAAEMDWVCFTREVKDRRLAEPAAAGLAYLFDVTGAAAPEGLLETLRRDSSPILRDEFSVYRQTNWPRTAQEDLAVARGALERVLARTGSPGRAAFVPTPPVRDTLAAGQHDYLVPVADQVMGSRLARLTVVIAVPRMLMQSQAEVLFFAPGLPLGRQKVLANASGQLTCEIVLPSDLLRLRRIEHLRLEIYLPAYAAKDSAGVTSTWLVQV